LVRRNSDRVKRRILTRGKGLARRVAMPHIKRGRDTNENGRAKAAVIRKG
jgi:hypothetical protein